MSRTYSTELKEQILNEYQIRRSIRALAADYEPHEMTVCSWIRKHQVIPHVGVESEAEDQKRLRRELRHLQEANAIQKKPQSKSTRSPPRFDSPLVVPYKPLHQHLNMLIPVAESPSQDIEFRVHLGNGGCTLRRKNLNHISGFCPLCHLSTPNTCVA